MKYFNIKNKNNKFLREDEIPSGTKWGVGWISASPIL